MLGGQQMLDGFFSVIATLRNVVVSEIDFWRMWSTKPSLNPRLHLRCWTDCRDTHGRFEDRCLLVLCDCNAWELLGRFSGRSLRWQWSRCAPDWERNSNRPQILVFIPIHVERFVEQVLDIGWAAAVWWVSNDGNSSEVCCGHWDGILEKMDSNTKIQTTLS